MMHQNWLYQCFHGNWMCLLGRSVAELLYQDRQYLALLYQCQYDIYRMENTTLVFVYHWHGIQTELDHKFSYNNMQLLNIK